MLDKDQKSKVMRIISTPEFKNKVFLINTCQFLFNYYLRMYRNTKNTSEDIMYLVDGEYKLTLDEKKRILKAHRFGVVLEPLSLDIIHDPPPWDVQEQPTVDNTSQKVFRNVMLHSLRSDIKHQEKLLTSENWENFNHKNLIMKIKTQSQLLKNMDIIHINRGIVTGYNKAFVIDEDTKNQLIHDDPKNAEIIKPVLHGSDIKDHRINFSNNYLIFTRHGINISEYPVIEKYLSKYKKNLQPKSKNTRNKRQKGRSHRKYNWYEIQSTGLFYKDFEKSKIVYPTIAHHLMGVFDTNQYYLLDSCFMITCDDDKMLKVIDAILSSELVNYILQSSIEHINNRGLRFNKKYIEHITIRNPNKKIAEKLVNQKQKIIKGYEKLDENLDMDVIRQIQKDENILNELVYELYELQEPEIKLIKDYLAELDIKANTNLITPHVE